MYFPPPGAVKLSQPVGSLDQGWWWIRATPPRGSTRLKLCAADLDYLIHQLEDVILSERSESKDPYTAHPLSPGTLSPVGSHIFRLAYDVALHGRLKI